MSVHEEFRAMLEAGNVNGLLRHWATVYPKMPQPENYEIAQAMMHRARTEAKSISFKARAYSHAWMTERGLPSGLPENLRPKAERMYPKIVSGVGISVNSRSKWLKPATLLVRQAMEDVVSDAYANGDQYNTTLLQARMKEAKEREMKKLFGGIGKPK